MNILIAGASGFIGKNLVNVLEKTHNITVLGRDSDKLKQRFSPSVLLKTWDDLTTLNAQKYDAIINLSGQNIAAARWSRKIKHDIVHSRIDTNHQLISWLNAQNAKPHFICANAVGIYGLQKNGDKTAFDENSPINRDCPTDFLNEVGVRWEDSLKPALANGISVTTIRLGVVLQKGEGFLKKITPSFYMGLGSLIGDGNQAISWIHIDDVIGAIIFLLQHPTLTGSFNLTSPNPVTQAEFANALAVTLHRPLFLTIPKKIIHLLFGEMGECLLLRGQRVVPKRLIEEGYVFSYTTCEKALQKEFA